MRSVFMRYPNGRAKALGAPTRSLASRASPPALRHGEVVSPYRTNCALAQPCRLLLGTLGAVLGTGLATIVDAGGVQGTTDDVVTDTGKVLHTAAANHHDGVFLKVVAFAGDVSGNFDTVGQAHTGDLTESGVRLLGGGGVHAGAHAAALGAFLQGRGLLSLHHLLPFDTDKLLNSRHGFLQNWTQGWAKEQGKIPSPLYFVKEINEKRGAWIL